MMPQSSLRLLVACAMCMVGHSAYSAELGQGSAAAPVLIRSLLPEKPLCRACRPAGVEAIIENRGDVPATVESRLVVPEDVQLVGSDERRTIVIDAAAHAKAVWQIEARNAGPCDLRLEVSEGTALVATESLRIDFLPAVEQQKLPYIPEPQPVDTTALVGAHNCPLWEADRPEMWSQLLKHPERTPALGFYAQENPEVADWETKWAVEHGVSYFIYCWYRASQGEPVKMKFGSAIHDALFKSKFVDKMKFTIMWENQARGVAGVADERDLMENLLPFWIENYFKHPSYLKIDNKPLLFIYRPEFLIDDLGGIEKVSAAFDRMRQACKDAGFDGLYLLGEYRGLDVKHLKLMKQLGLDYTFAYCWYVPNNPTPQQSVDAQMEYIKKTHELGIIPEVVTVSQAWSGWRDEGTIWKLPPPDFRRLLQQAKDYIATFPASELGSKLLILDNWNEWGEGHYIAPYREYEFGYLDAVRDVFAKNPGPHVDLIPEDIGLGPYDTAYRNHTERSERLLEQRTKRVTKSGSPEKGLVAWWTFDEEPDCPVALDYSGHRLGGIVHDAQRAEGIDGRALVCKGGCVEVPASPLLDLAEGFTIECWIKTDVAGQGNSWFVNRVFGGGEANGYRMGVLEGNPCIEVPATPWSHHLRANAALETGRWVHVAGTFDGKVERIYIDGKEQGSMDRPGPVNPSTFHLILGNYEIGHPAFFNGLLDEVKIYDRAMTADEVRARFESESGKTSK